MLSWLLEIVNGGVVDDKYTGPSEYVGTAPIEIQQSKLFIMLLIATTIGIFIGYGIRSIVQKYRDLPDEILPSNNKEDTESD